ncbi:hypothetical protein G6F37_003753 [Rhizopus arrhizus]|nr:hypothetical protein G6F37_003753 [Rhizopus arrhizus]
MYTAYINNMGAYFDNHFRRAINSLLQIRQRRIDLIRQRQEEGMDNEAISNEIYEQITLLARQFKEILASRIVDPSSIKLPFQDPIYTQALQRLTPILTLYPVQYTFEQNNIYYDAKANPCEHTMAFHQLARLFETLRLPIFNCFPLRRTQIPNYTIIDSKIFCQSILERRWINGINKMNLWAEIIDMNSAALKPQELGVLRFRGTIQTEELEVYITGLNAQQHEEITDCCVTIDPERRNLLYCVHENSTADAPRTYRHTKSCQGKMEKAKKYRRICEAVKPQEVQNTEDTPNPVMLTELLQRHYTETTTNYLPTHPLHRKLKLSKCIRRQKASEDIVAKLKSKFGNDAIFAMDNYSAPNIRYQESVRGVGFRRLLKNMDSWCIEELRERLWNRDLVACLNMSYIACNLRLNDEILERFQHAEAERRDPTRRRSSEEDEERRVLPRTL